MPRFLWFLLLIAVISTSCISRKKLNYFQDAPLASGNGEYSKNERIYSKIEIRPFDVLTLRVLTEDESINEAFKIVGGPQAGGGGGGGQLAPNYFNGTLVDVNGYLNLPLLDTVYVKGLTLLELEEKIRTLLGEYVLNKPYVSAKFATFRIYVFGEVSRTGLIDVDNERANLLDLLGESNDFELFANRRNVRVFRGAPDSTVVYEIDMTSISAMEQPGFYLHPYDVVYVEPLVQKTFFTNVQTFNVIVALLNTGIALYLVLQSFNN